MTSNKTKSNYNLLLSLAFIAIGGYRLYTHFMVGALPTYQWVLAIGLVGLGIYQIIANQINKNKINKN